MRLVLARITSGTAAVLLACTGLAAPAAFGQGSGDAFGHRVSGASGQPAAIAAPRYLSTPQVDPKPPAQAARERATRLLADPLVTDGVPERIGGDGRYATAAQIANLYGTSNAVIVANGSNQKGGFDALSANYLAGQLSAPVVLTAGSTLEPEVAAAIQTVLSGSTQPAIYVMGLADSVSDAEVAALNALAVTISGVDGQYVTRIGGAGRYATSALTVTAFDGAQVGAVDSGASPRLSLPTAILASGTSNADALAAGPLSNAWGLPVLLTAADHLSPEITAVISDLGIRQLIVLGGADRISDAVVTQAQQAGAGRIKRIAGKNRFATAAQLFRLAATTFVGPSGSHYVSGGRAFVANGVNGFPDALAVGPLAGRLGSPLLTAAADDVDSATLKFLADNQQSLYAITVLGKAQSVGNNVLIAAKAATNLSILAGADGVIPAADDTNAKYLAAAAKLSSFDAKLKLARTYLPNDGAGIGKLYPYMLSGWEDDAAGLTQFVTCDVWMDSTLPDDQILDIFRHEYIHVLQCQAENKNFDAGYDLKNDTVVNGVERGADAGAYLLGNTYMYYVQYGPTAGPIQVSELDIAERLFKYFKVTYTIG